MESESVLRRTIWRSIRGLWLVNTYMLIEWSLRTRRNVTVQLLRRRFEVKDANGGYRMIDGEGVIGLQPNIGARGNPSVYI